MNLKFSYLLLFLFLCGTTAYSQITNVLLSDTVHLNKIVDESSGLTYASGRLWSHNDGGGKPEIYAINPNNGSVTQIITLEGVNNNDWEDITASGEYLYIADTGNNQDGARTNLAIYKIRLADIPATGNATIPNNKIGIIRFYYPEQGITPIAVKGNSTAYDCEAIFIMNDEIHLFTKDWTSKASGYGSSEYILPTVPNPQGLKYVAEFYKRHNNMGFLVTGADYSEKTRQVALIGYQDSENFGVHFIKIYSDFIGNDISTGTVFTKSIGIPLSIGQAEGICFGDNPNQGWISNEEFSISVLSIPFFYPAALRRFFISYNPEDKDSISY